MKLILKLILGGIVTLLSLTKVAAQQPKQVASIKDCIRPILSQSHGLTDSIQQYLKYVGDYEIPIIVKQRTDDTTHYFISAFLGTYMIKKNPPSAIITVNNREILLYTGGESIAQTAPTCYSYVLRKYSHLLKMDKMNRREGRPPSYEHDGFSYDPIKGVISVTEEGIIRTKQASKIPFIKYD